MEGRPDRNARRSNQEDRKQFVPCKYWSFRPHHPKTSVPGCQPRFLLGPVHGDSHLLHKQLLYIHAVTCQLTVTPRCMLAWTITPSTSELMQRGVTLMSLAVCDLLPVFAAKHNHEAVSDPQTTAWRHSAVESSLSGCGPRFLLGSGKCGHSCSFHACSGFSSEAPSLRPCTLTVTPRCIDAAAGCCRRCPRL